MFRRCVVPASVGVLLVALSLAVRLLPDYRPPNFTPVAASAMFAWFFYRRWWAAAVPLLALGLSDVALGGYDWRIMTVVYLSLALPGALATRLRGDFSAWRVGVCSLAASLVFFLATNVAVWLFAGFYPRNLDGLTRCFWAALPFLRYTIAGDLFWSAMLFGGYALALRLSPSSPSFDQLVPLRVPSRRR